MQRIPPQFITASVGWHFTLWTWREIKLRNWKRRSGMVC